MFDRKEMSNRYFIEWKPKYDIYHKDTLISVELMAECYQEYRRKLIEFVNELDTYVPNISKVSYKPNHRQNGAYQRCVLRYPDPGWEHHKLLQFSQGYKELMVDFLHYSDELEYDEISLEEIQTMKKMAYFLICQAEINKYEITTAGMRKCDRCGREYKYNPEDPKAMCEDCLMEIISGFWRKRLDVLADCKNLSKTIIYDIKRLTFKKYRVDWVTKYVNEIKQKNGDFNEKDAEDLIKKLEDYK